MCIQEYIDHLGSANSDDMLSIPGDCREFDEYQKMLSEETGDLLGVPNDPPLHFKIEISDEPMPESYWLTINDT